jgi:hypothetical protein
MSPTLSGLLAELVMLAHFGFVVFVIAGGLLVVWRSPLCGRPGWIRRRIHRAPRAADPLSSKLAGHPRPVGHRGGTRERRLLCVGLATTAAIGRRVIGRLAKRSLL